ncbi:MAG: GGDEF domain-containing protein [Planctomycetes bacterium]|nr:GGDEF domain-containing protein [Planctomycetota bacterium]
MRNPFLLEGISKTVPERGVHNGIGGKMPGLTQMAENNTVAAGRPACRSLSAPMDLSAVAQAGIGTQASTDAGRKEETIRPYINKAVLTLSPYQTIYDACCLMRRNHIGCVVVTNRDKPVGIVSESTIVKQVASGRSLHTELGKVMSKHIIFSSPDKPISAALELMHRHHIRRLPVMENGVLSGIVTQTDLLEASCRLINNLKSRHTRLSEIAGKDELTGLYNRRYFKEVFEDELARTRRYGGLLSLVLLDIDHFKQINDCYGHSAGDKILQEMASIIKGNARGVDTSVRYGGEEFAVLLPGVGTRAAHLFAERLRAIIEGHEFNIGSEHIKLTISGGVCKWTSELDSMPSMINEADKYLYQAKESGRNKILVAQ